MTYHRSNFAKQLRMVLYISQVAIIMVANCQIRKPHAPSILAIYRGVACEAECGVGY